VSFGLLAWWVAHPFHEKQQGLLSIIPPFQSPPFGRSVPQPKYHHLLCAGVGVRGRRRQRLRRRQERRWRRIVETYGGGSREPDWSLGRDQAPFATQRIEQLLAMSSAQPGPRKGPRLQIWTRQTLGKGGAEVPSTTGLRDEEEGTHNPRLALVLALLVEEE
jgi:hypothetical protein